MEDRRWLGEYCLVDQDLPMVFMQIRVMVVALKKEVHNHLQLVL
jgi:hypothetical protein